MPPHPCFAILQYDGRHFAGWQRQPADRTVQAEFEAILERLTGGRVVAHAAGRTDSGVHALGQVVSFALPERWQLRAALRAIRALSPPDLWLARIGAAPPGFHARKHALSRRYRYVVGCDAAAASPFRRGFEWAVGEPADGGVLRRTAGLVRGEHDFRAFATAGPAKQHYRCRVAVSEWQARPDQQGFIFTIEADRFLHRMVRFLVGTMVEMARGRRPVHDLERLLAAAHNQDTSPPAPPQGLFFIGARYEQLDEGYEQ